MINEWGVHKQHSAGSARDTLVSCALNASMASEWTSRNCMFGGHRDSRKSLKDSVGLVSVTFVYILMTDWLWSSSESDLPRWALIIKSRKHNGDRSTTRRRFWYSDRPRVWIISECVRNRVCLTFNLFKHQTRLTISTTSYGKNVWCGWELRLFVTNDISMEVQLKIHAFTAWTSCFGREYSRRHWNVSYTI